MTWLYPFNVLGSTLLWLTDREMLKLVNVVSERQLVFSRD